MLSVAPDKLRSISKAAAVHRTGFTPWDDETNDARRLKQAILGVSHGVELLLKERLRRVHPALVWENVDKYPNLSARTVGVGGALSRLANIGGVTFSTSDVALIRSLRDTRNAVEHYLMGDDKN